MIFISFLVEISMSTVGLFKWRKYCENSVVMIGQLVSCQFEWLQLTCTVEMITNELQGLGCRYRR